MRYLLGSLSLVFNSSTHYKSAVRQIMKMGSIIKIQGAIKGVKWAEGDLEDLDY